MMKQYRLTLITCILLHLPLVQAQAKKFEYDPVAIYNAVSNCLRYWHEGNHGLLEEAKPYLQSLDLGEKVTPVNINELFKEPYHLNTASISLEYPYQLTKRANTLYLIERSIGWLSGQRGGQDIDKSVQESRSLGLDRLKSLFYESFKEISSKFYLWQYALIALSIFLLRIIYGIIVFVSGKLIHRLTKRWAPDYPKYVRKLFSAAIVILLSMALLPILQLPEVVEESILLLLRGGATFSVSLLCYRSIDPLLITYLNRRVSEKKTEVNAQLLPLLRTLLKVAVVVAGTLYTLRSLNINTSALLAGVSIGSVAFALASQDTIKHLFGSLMIFFDKPFRVGDAIVTGAIKGEVEEIGLRSTRIRTNKDSVISVPNAKLAGETVDNYGQGEYHHFCTHLAVAYNTPVDLIERFLEGLNKIVASHPHTRKDKYFIHLENIQSSKLEILFYVYFNVKNYSKELQCRHEVLLNIIKLAEEVGISLT